MSQQQYIAQDQPCPPAYSQSNFGPSGFVSGPVTIQPQQVGQHISNAPTRVWMPLPSEPVANCPPGLEYLTMVDQLIVHELLNVAEVLSGFDMANKYEIKNSVGQNCYFAVEGILIIIKLINIKSLIIVLIR
jgi:hypothetical protein